MSVSVTVSIVCKDLTGGFAGGACTVPAGSSIGEALAACLEDGHAAFAGDLDYLTVCLRNGRRASYGDAVEEGDEIYILRKIVGG